MRVQALALSRLSLRRRTRAARGPTAPASCAAVVVAAAALQALLLLGAAPAARAASLSLEKSPVVLGRMPTVGVVLRVEEPPGSEDRPLRLSVNVGTFGEVTRVEPGVYRTVYTPPSTRFPQVALVAAWRETGPDAHIDFLRLPLWGSTTIDAVAPPGAEVVAQIGSAEYGPVVTNAKGRATVAVDVPPDVPEAIIRIRDRAGVVITRRATVSVPGYNRLTMALVPHAILANGEDWARLEVFYDAATAITPDKVILRASEGSAHLLSAEGGRLSYRYQPPPGTPSREVTFSVKIAGDAAAAGAAKLSLGLPPPSIVEIKPPDKPLYADGHSAAAVEVHVFDDKHLGLPHQNIELMANGHPVRGLEYKGQGVYEVRYVAPAAYPDAGLVRFAATVFRGDGTSLAAHANYQVLAPPIPTSLRGEVHPRPVLADGESRAVIALDVRDKSGAPLPGAQLIAMTDQGSVSPVLEVGEGRYRIDFIAPDGAPPGLESLVKVIDSSNRFEQVLSVPLREPQHLMLGVRGGFSATSSQFRPPRVGLDAWAPFRLGSASFAAQLAASLGWAGQYVVGPTGTSHSRAYFVPVSLRLAFAPLVGSRFALYLGAGPQLTWARVRNDANGYDSQKVGVGVSGMLGGSMNLGPGQLFGEASWGWAPLEHRDFHLDAGGLGVELGYRFGLF